MYKKEFRKTPNFTGSFKTYSVSVSTNREKGTESRLLVYSSGSRAATFEYLWLKFLWDHLTKIEYELLLASNEFLLNDYRYTTFRLMLENPKKSIRNKLLRIQLFLGMKLDSRERYLGYKRMRIDIQRITRSLQKVPKFSGYVRNASAVGSKRPGGPGIPEPLPYTEEYCFTEKLDWEKLFSVGGLSELFSGSVVYHPDES